MTVEALEGKFSELQLCEIEDTYGVPLEKLKEPEGYEFTGEFRDPEWGETFLADFQGPLEARGNLYGPRLILRKAPTIKDTYGRELKEIVLPKGLEYVKVCGAPEFRVPKLGELALSAPGASGSFRMDSISAEAFKEKGHRRLIVRKRQPEAEEIRNTYGKPKEEVTVPEGYEFTGEFREAQVGDLVLQPFSRTPWTWREGGPWGDEARRLILREKVKKDPIEEAYQCKFGDLRIPEGFAVQMDCGRPMFREPKKGEWILDKSTRVQHQVANEELFVGHPYLILHKIDPLEDLVADLYDRPLSQITPPSGWEFVIENGRPACRKPNKGEWVLATRSAGYAFEIEGDVEYLPGKPFRLIVQKEDKVRKEYGKPLGELTAPEGWKFTGEFRSAAKGEEYLCAVKGCLAVHHTAGGIPGDPVLILTPSQSILSVYGKKFSELSVPPGYRFLKDADKPVFRPPQKGEPYLSTIAGCVAYCSAEGFAEKRLILEDRIKEVYGRGITELPIPQGYELLQENGNLVFRVPNGGEPYLGRPLFDVLTNGSPATRYADGKRLLLRRVAPTTPRRWVFEETGETRTINPGEYLLYKRTDGGYSVREFASGSRGLVGPVMRLVEKPDTGC